MLLGTRQVAFLDRMFHPISVWMPPKWTVRLYSGGRESFREDLVEERPDRVKVPGVQNVELWGLKFRSPLLNAAGMFKTGVGYDLVARQGAGSFLAGTTTTRSRSGNRKDGIVHPFAPYPRSGAASNWLGLPNPGHRKVARTLARIRRADGCPVGASIAADPGQDIPLEKRLEDLVTGLRLYEEARVDFIEINESCPNTGDEESTFEDLEARLTYISNNFLAKRRRPLPVVVKFSNDTELSQVPRLLDTLINLGFDGVNFGNTTTKYRRVRAELAKSEIKLFDFFVKNFGGGVSGRPLRESSLYLVSFAGEHLSGLALDREFHIIRTGGVETAKDVKDSLNAGASLVQWYTGYFSAYGRHGHELYQKLWEDYHKPPE